MNAKQNLILLLASLTTEIGLSEPSLVEKKAAENAAIKKKKEWESWNATIFGLRSATAVQDMHLNQPFPTGSRVEIEPAAGVR
ncbi:MAG: hypothetical protein U1F65_06320 [Verrucomicrobiota bacterium]